MIYGRIFYALFQKTRLRGCVMLYNSRFCSVFFVVQKADDGETPDVAATEEEEEGTKKVIGDRTKMNIEAFFSPTFLLCILFFAAAVFGFS